jgi:polyisoprenyl-phosphate glycosyltransferase
MYGDRLPGRNAIQRSSRRGSYSGPDVTVHTRKAVSVSLLVPMYNEEESADLFLDTVQPLLSEITDDYEIICVSDGSTDSTVERLLERRAMDGRIKIIELSRNFGKEAALSAAIDVCSKDVAIPIDVDLQDPPELIGQMIAKWREGYDVVYAVRAQRPYDGLLKRLTAGAFYRVFSVLSGTKLPNAPDFRLLDRQVVAALRLLPERNRFMKGLFVWVGFRQTAITFQRSQRRAGATKYRYWSMWNNAIDAITSFSTTPLRLWTYVGFLLSTASFAYGLIAILQKLLGGYVVQGWASIIAVVAFLGGIQLMSLGIMGEYLGRIYSEIKGRPIYLVRNAIGLEADENAARLRKSSQLVLQEHEGWN